MGSLSFIDVTSASYNAVPNSEPSSGACYAFLCNAGAWHMLRS